MAEAGSHQQYDRLTSVKGEGFPSSSTGQCASALLPHSTENEPSYNKYGSIEQLVKERAESKAHQMTCVSKLSPQIF